MKGPTVAVVGVLLLAAAAPVSAQGPFIFFAAGPTFPASLYKSEDHAKTGWMTSFGVGVPVGGKGLMLGAELNYGMNSHGPPEPAGDKTRLYGASGFLGYRFGDAAKAGLYLLGSGGTMKHDFRSTANPTAQGGNFEFAWSLGAGVDVPVGGVNLYLESRYFQRGDTRFIPIFAGVMINVGKGG